MSTPPRSPSPSPAILDGAGTPESDALEAVLPFRDRLAHDPVIAMDLGTQDQADTQATDMAEGFRTQTPDGHGIVRGGSPPPVRADDPSETIHLVNTLMKVAVLYDGLYKFLNEELKEQAEGTEARIPKFLEKITETGEEVDMIIGALIWNR